MQDEGRSRRQMADGLAAAGYSVMQATSGEDAVRIIRQETGAIDLLLTEIRLSGALDGWNVAFEYQYHRPFGPVLYLSDEPDVKPPVAGTVLKISCGTDLVLREIRRLLDAPA